MRANSRRPATGLARVRDRGLPEVVAAAGLLLVGGGICSTIGEEGLRGADLLFAGWPAVLVGGAVFATARFLPAKGRAGLVCVLAFGLLLLPLAGLLDSGVRAESVGFILGVVLLLLALAGLYAANRARAFLPDSGPAATIGTTSAVVTVLSFVLPPFLPYPWFLSVLFFAGPLALAGVVAAILLLIASARTIGNHSRRGLLAGEMARENFRLLVTGCVALLIPAAVVALGSAFEGDFTVMGGFLVFLGMMWLAGAGLTEALAVFAAAPPATAERASGGGGG